MVVKLSDRVEIEWFRQVSPISEVREDEIAVSGIGTIAAARVTPRGMGVAPFIAVSMYARWIRPHPSTHSRWGVGYPDASAHRIISDLSAFIGSTDPGTHRILAAGDLNTIYGATDDNRLALPARDRTITDRMNALGLEFLGPRYPAGPAGQTHAPGPASGHSECAHVSHDAASPPRRPRTSSTTPSASRGFHESVEVHAMNSIDEWGASDHCRLLIEVSG